MRKITFFLLLCISMNLNTMRASFHETVPWVKVEKNFRHLGVLQLKSNHTIDSHFKVNNNYYIAFAKLYEATISPSQDDTSLVINAKPFESYILEQYTQKQPWYEKCNKAFIGASYFFGCTTFLFGYLWWKKK